MASKKSKPYSIDGSKYSFEFDTDGKFLGIKKQDENGNFKPLDPTSSEFLGLEMTDEAVEAYNIANYGGNTDLYVEDFTEVEESDELLKKQLFDNQTKKSNNQQFLEDNTLNKNPIAFTTPKSPTYKKNVEYRGSDLMAYPLDIDLEQDHFKITRYNYIRPDINQSKPSQDRGGHYAKVAGDSVTGSELKGSVILPMPKPTDVFSAKWGEEQMTAREVAAMGAANFLTFGGRLTGKTPEQRRQEREARDAQGRQNFGGLLGRTKQMSQQMIAETLVNQANDMFGTSFETDQFLARTGGKVQNPNAEMLFQGPMIRAFPFQFQMIARSEREGKEIRKIIKFFKSGMAPKFRNTVFLETPDIFTLTYKNGRGDNDVLKTVNRFSPGGLALTSMNVDYAPSGYWSAYRDSQPIAVKMDLSFTELRPLYQTDQDKDTPEDSVGY